MKNYLRLWIRFIHNLIKVSMEFLRFGSVRFDLLHLALGQKRSEFGWAFWLRSTTGMILCAMNTGFVDRGVNRLIFSDWLYITSALTRMWIWAFDIPSTWMFSLIRYNFVNGRWNCKNINGDLKFRMLIFYVFLFIQFSVCAIFLNFTTFARYFFRGSFKTSVFPIK